MYKRQAFMQMEKVGKVVLSLGMILSLLAAYNVKNNIKAEESDTNTIEENKNGPQQNRYYTIIDENGQVIVEEYESEDDEPKTCLLYTSVNPIAG